MVDVACTGEVDWRTDGKPECVEARAVLNRGSSTTAAVAKIIEAAGWFTNEAGELAG